jgi:Zn-dependent M16 (insulinase) family peptidase
VRKALQEAGIGSDVYASNQGMLQNIFSIVVQNADPGDKEKFRTIVMNTLQKVVAEKIDRETLKGAINRLEFNLREGNDAQKGISYDMRVLNPWIYTDNPFAALEYEKTLSAVKESLTGTMLEDMIKSNMIDNQYGLIISVEPKPGLEKELAGKIEQELAEAKKKMSAVEIDTILARTKALIAFQQTQDSPEAIATVPMLKLSDIDPQARYFEPVSEKVGSVPHVFYNDFTNGIIYLDYWFNLEVLTEDKLPYASLLTQLIGKMDAGKYSYGQLDNALNINTGGYNAFLSTYLPAHNDNGLLPYMKITMKTTPDKLDTSLALLGDILSKTQLGDKDRLYELLKRHQSQLESSMNQNGYGVAATRLESYYSRRGVFSEKTRGIDYYWFITDLTRKFNDNPEAVINTLKEVYGLLFTRANMIGGVICADEDFKKYSGKFGLFEKELSENPVSCNNWKLEPSSMNEGILTASKVQYVMQGFDFNKLNMKWDGKWYVLNQIMSTDWLQTQIRVVGGAYGGFSNISKNGTISFASYRDPNLSETLDNFKGTVNYLSKFEADSSAMCRYIIGTISNLDYPMTASDKGEQAFRWYFEQVTKQELQADRDAVLATTASDIRNMSGSIENIINQKVYCVYGNDNKVTQNKSLFKTLVKLQK